MERSGLEKKKRLENNSDDTDIDQSTQASLAGFGAGGAFWNKLLESCVCGSGRKEKTSSLPCTHRTQTLRMARHPLAKSSGFRLPEIWNHMHRWCGRFNTQSFMYRKPESSKKVAKVRYQQIIYRTNADIVILPPFMSWLGSFNGDSPTHSGMGFYNNRKRSFHLPCTRSVDRSRIRPKRWQNYDIRQSSIDKMLIS